MTVPLRPDQVERVATLARLALDPAERTRLAAELGRILEFAGQIASLDTRTVEADTAFLEVAPIEREDEPGPCLEREAALANAPRAAGDLFTVPRLAAQRERRRAGGRDAGGGGR